MTSLHADNPQRGMLLFSIFGNMFLPRGLLSGAIRQQGGAEHQRLFISIEVSGGADHFFFKALGVDTPSVCMGPELSFFQFKFFYSLCTVNSPESGGGTDTVLAVLPIL